MLGIMFQKFNKFDNIILFVSILTDQTLTRRLYATLSIIQ